MAKWWKWILNPVGAAVQTWNENTGSDASKYANLLTNPVDFIKDTVELVKGTGKDSVKGMVSNALNNVAGTNGDVGTAVSKLWNDYTGQTAIDKQLEANKDLAQYQTDLQEELYNRYSSPEALMRQYSAAGLNPNLVYGSASSGQGNVPSYSAPSAPLNLSYSDKFNKALQMMSSVLGVKNLVYSTVANREAAEQSYLKTLQENARANDMINNSKLNSSIIGSVWSNLFKSNRYFKGGSVSTVPSALDTYAEAIRNGKINSALRAGLSNQYEFGKYHTPLYSDILDGGLPEGIFHPAAFWDIKNKTYAAQQRLFDYDWDQEYKTMLKGAGVAAPIIQTLLRILGGK